MKRIVLCMSVSLLLMVTACTNKNKVPSSVMGMEKMEKVLWDMIQADRFSAGYLVKDTTKDVKIETLRVYQQVFQLHDISKEEFIKSYKYYLGRPDLTKVMFDSIAARANRSREDMYKQPVVDTGKPAIDTSGLRIKRAE